MAASRGRGGGAEQTGSRPAIFSLFGNRRATKERPNIQAVVVDAHELLWSNSLGAKASSDITPEERARQETIHELLKTEVTYLDSLREIDAVRGAALDSRAKDG